MDLSLIFATLGARIATRHELIACGVTGRALASAVKTGRLARVRRDRYALPGSDRHLIEAVRVGGLFACTSALADIGVFAFDNRVTHVHLERAASRPRDPHNGRLRLARSGRRDIEVHWTRLIDPTAATRERVGLVDALVQSASCQDPRHTIASIDNALHQGLIGESEISMIFDALPTNRQYLRGLLDARAESGQESVLRLLLQHAGLRFEVQVHIPGVGRVDFLVEGILILEADSRLAHDGWDAHVRDATRDITSGQLGYLTLRPLYEHTMHQPELVLAAIRGVLDSGRALKSRRIRSA
jgi:very-short-patch-repair endonuclease